MTEQPAHAKLSASGAHRWMSCPGSIRMEEGVTETTSVFAAEGTAAHELAESCLRKRWDADLEIGAEFNGFTVDEEMAGYVQEYIDHVHMLLSDSDLEIEARVDFSPWVPGGFGTADAIILRDGHVDIIDLKYGKGVKVDAHENPQLKLYALGVLNDFGLFYDIQTIGLNIVQPRKDHISEWGTAVADLERWGERAADCARAALSDDAPLVPGTAQCRFCKARHFCKARADENMNRMFDGYQDFNEPGQLKNPNTLSPDDVAAILNYAKEIKNWIGDVDRHALSLLERGRDVPGFKLVRSNPHRKWADEEAAGKALTRKLKKSGAYTQKLISPAEAEKRLGTDSRIVKDHAIKPQGAIVVAPDADKRQAVVCNVLEGFDVLDEAARPQQTSKWRNLNV